MAATKKTVTQVKKTVQKTAPKQNPPSKKKATTEVRKAVKGKK